MGSQWKQPRINKHVQTTDFQTWPPIFKYQWQFYLQQQYVPHTMWFGLGAKFSQLPTLKQLTTGSALVPQIFTIHSASLHYRMHFQQEWYHPQGGKNWFLAVEESWMLQWCVALQGATVHDQIYPTSVALKFQGRKEIRENKSNKAP